MTEAAFDALITAQPQFSSANWTGTQPDLAQSQFEIISVGGGRFFADELRIGTGFANVTVPEPATMAVLAFGGIAVLRRRRRA